MVQIEVLKEQKGSNSFGMCLACGKYSSEDDRMIRLILSRKHSYGISACLCFKCAGELMEDMIEIRADQIAGELMEDMIEIRADQMNAKMR